MTGWGAKYAKINLPISLEGLKYLTSLKYLEIRYTTLSDISFLEEMTNIEVLRLDNNSISDISSIESLINLKYLDLSNNQVTNIKALKNLQHLGEGSWYYFDSPSSLYRCNLGLENNALYDRFSYYDENGNTVTENTLDILAQLNVKYNLKCLYISGNSGIIDYSPLIKQGNVTLTWEKRGGF